MGLSAAERTIADRVAQRRDVLLEDLRRHVEIPTGMGHKAGLDESRALLTARLAKLGASVRLVPGAGRPAWLEKSGGEIPPTAVCDRTAGVQGPRVLCVGHLDTVHDPRSSFRTLTVQGAKATGPGCVDMKGGLVIAVAALEVLEECGVKLAWTFALNSDEETGSFHSDAALREQAKRHDLGLVFEPALPDGSLVIERPGSGQFMIRARGKAAHVGRDFASGVSAIRALARCVEQAETLSEPAEGRILNVGLVSGGTATNVVPEHAVAWGNTRYAAPDVADMLRCGLDALATPGEGLPKVEVFHTWNRPAKPCTDGTLRLAHLAQGAAQDLGQVMPLGKTGGVCDGNNLQAGGLPTIDTLGVRGGALHTEQEWIELPSLVERCRLLAVLLSRLASGAWDEHQGRGE